ncbi:hypothetical protein RhiirA4_479905 [Rhizophagus irregularis]|uniref:Uncharacterized protein n=1 Tax=Rhizophagus irregularis TaxID=588596 RepID=A0A2I1HH42_9GLOM|nr:hypothetical protein RhiirA4_479905 [Rhizophagus irregularis]
MSTQETNGESSSGVLLNTNKEKEKSERKRGPVWIHFNDIGTKKEGHISFSYPFFINMVKSLYNGYEPPCSTTLSNTLMNNELTKITVDQQLTLDKESDLTLDKKNKFYF